jgi:hypothetical protein
MNTNPVEPFYTNPDFIDALVLAGFKAELRQLYAQHYLDSSVLDDNAARFAMYWMASDPYNNMDVYKKEKLNRFVLACFYYSTNMVASPYATKPMYWRSALNWLTPKSTCEWEGVTCDNDLNVVSPEWSYP